MAEERESIIIDVQFDGGDTATKLKDVQQAMRFLQNENAALKKQMKDLDRTTAEGAEAFAKLSTQYAINTEQIKSLKVSEQVLQQAQMDLGVQATITGDSFKEQARQLAVMKNAYSQMSKAERESASGKEFLKKLQELDAQVKANDASMGNFQRNVGNYPKVFDLTNTSIGKLVAGLQGMGGQAQTTGQFFSGAFAQMTTGLKGFGKAFLTPPIAVITVVVGGIILLFEKLKEAFKKNDDAMTSLQRAMASFQPIIDVVNKALNAMIERIVKVIDGIGKMVAFLSGWITGSEGAADAARNMVDSMDELEEKERQYTVQAAKNAQEISDLRAKVAEKDKYTAKEREEMLQSAIDLETENLDRQKDIAKQRLAILKQEAEQRNDQSDEMKNKIAEAEAEVYRVQEQYNTGTRRLKAEMSNLRMAEAKEAEETAKAVIKAREAMAAEEQRTADELAAKRLQIEREYQDAMLGMIADRNERRLTEIELQTGREVEALRQRMAELSETETTARAQLQAMIDAKEAEAEEQRKQVYAQMAEDEYNAEMQKIETERQLNTLKAETEQERIAAEIEAKTAEAEMLRTIDAETKAALFESEDAYLIKKAETEQALAELNQKAIDGEKQRLAQARLAAQQNAAAIGGALGSLSNLLDQFGEDNREAAIASKALALGEIAVQTGLAIAKGTSEAMSVPFPANIAAIATTVATVLANIVSAVSTVKSAKFATGGVVDGDPTKIDSVPAMLTAGEVVLNADQQARLLYSLAQGNVAAGVDNAATLRAAFSEALQDMPAPVMVYREFEEFKARTTQYNELTAL
ncbi:MAG: hypothetical protein IIT93_03695 [Paludibacteraceae bacterium]|nr:hypothetical protein [Paludibacteraceae bacterium]